MWLHRTKEDSRGPDIPRIRSLSGRVCWIGVTNPTSEGTHCEYIMHHEEALIKASTSPVTAKAEQGPQCVFTRCVDPAFGSSRS